MMYDDFYDLNCDALEEELKEIHRECGEEFPEDWEFDNYIERKYKEYISSQADILYDQYKDDILTGDL